mmetsp:Transcript_5092/g.18479  ORF Transcript_5092/g.18479 Transcript_5092/m.18479 type:complete len:95 (+) Transcript_5092:58-342(+)
MRVCDANARTHALSLKHQRLLVDVVLARRAAWAMMRCAMCVRALRTGAQGRGGAARAAHGRGCAWVRRCDWMMTHVARGRLVARARVWATHGRG